MGSSAYNRRLMSLLHTTDPYMGFNANDYLVDLGGWNGNDPIFDSLIGEIRPQLIIEIGSWKGQSAVTMGRSVLQHGMTTPILCVDTWLGALEFWTDQSDATRYQSLRHKHGHPTVYYQFLANVVRAGLQNIIIPFPQTSAIAARWLSQFGIRADLIYIDGSHAGGKRGRDSNSWGRALPRSAAGTQRGLQAKGRMEGQPSFANVMTVPVERRWSFATK